MMLVLEVVTTAFFLVAGAAAQKPTTLEGSPVNTTPEREAIAIPHQLSAALISSLHNQTKTQTKVIPTNEHSISNSSRDSYENAKVVQMRQDIEPERNAKRSERMKRKVIFGGGSYGHSGRRGGAAVGGDPYGRRRDHHGPDGRPLESWPNNQSPGSYMGASMNTPTRFETTTRRSDYVIISRTTTSAPYIYRGSSSSTTDGSGRKREDLTSDLRKKSPSNVEKEEETPRQKLTKTLKWEIAKFALQNGSQQAADRYGKVLGRRLSPKKIEKFIKRYQKQQKRNRGYHQQ